MSVVVIRTAGALDTTALVDWNLAMAFETEGKRLDSAVVARGVVGVLEEPARGFYLVAERQGEPVGGLLVTYEWSDWRAGNFWWIQSVYVVPSARRSGVFQALFAEVEGRARKAAASGLRLYVDVDNAPAQQTYAHLGMRRCHYHMYELGWASGESI